MNTKRRSCRFLSTWVIPIACGPMVQARDYLDLSGWFCNVQTIVFFGALKNRLLCNR
eukprot:m.159177 g.159177  ORF g.159177 m.159177 type:complete len:57 (-) comp24784_c0_seq4:108-278(-)